MKDAFRKMFQKCANPEEVVKIFWLLLLCSYKQYSGLRMLKNLTFQCRFFSS